MRPVSQQLTTGQIRQTSHWPAVNCRLSVFHFFIGREVLLPLPGRWKFSLDTATRIGLNLRHARSPLRGGMHR